MMNIEDRIAEAKAQEGMPEMLDRYVHQEMPEGFTLIGTAPPSAAHLICLQLELAKEHEVVNAAHKAARGTPGEPAAEAAHMQNHDDFRAVKEEVMRELAAAFEEVGTTYNHLTMMARWQIIGRTMSPAEEIIRALFGGNAKIRVVAVPVDTFQD